VPVTVESWMKKQVPDLDCTEATNVFASGLATDTSFWFVDPAAKKLTLGSTACRAVVVASR
jgi:hypothetical protein